MLDAAAATERPVTDRHERPVTDRQWMQQALHDLSQPLSAMECHLYLCMMSSTAEMKTAELADTIRESHVQCERLMAHVRSMQHRLSANTT